MSVKMNRINFPGCRIDCVASPVVAQSRATVRPNIDL